MNVINSIQQSQLKSEIVSWQFIISGFVQGVGFRPFVFRLANELSIKGTISNNAGQVSIVAEGTPQSLDTFRQQLIHLAPIPAKPVIQSVSQTMVANYDNFYIKKSHELNNSDIHILPDLTTCDQCLDEMWDKNNRRYLYPFINCTQCGPRHSIIKALPYDRKSTSMQNFKLCDDCKQEYFSVTDRRFHAEPIACEACGPVLNFIDTTRNISDNQLALEACIETLMQGKIIAVKNIGGYHLMCDATSTEAIKLLRLRKQRPDKPFAILMELSKIEDYVETSKEELALLKTTSRPIVLLKRKLPGALPENLAPGLNHLGIMLPSNPLQHLICHYFKKPLVATSANISGEPIITDNTEASQRLTKICDAFLHHDRPIVRPADDPVMIVHHSFTQVLRTGRGLTPTELLLPFSLERPVLAVGGHVKNTIALAWQNRLVISAHNGELGNLRSYTTFKQAIDDLQTLYQVKTEQIICDAHSEYGSSRWASESAMPVAKIFHHHAHASCLALEYPQIQHWLVFTWDGVGLGDDGSLWGGETFLGQPGNWQRVVSFKPFRLPGGDKTAREAWRIAASLNWHSGESFQSKNENAEHLKEVWDKNMNNPESTAVGRLFSATASLLGLIDYESYEGHGPMLLEALAETSLAEAINLPLKHDERNLLRVDWLPLIRMLNNKSLSPAYRARCFHETLANTLCKICLMYTSQEKELAVGLSGGVFQNQLLLQLIQQRLDQHNVKFFMPNQIPVNDSGLCVGQVTEYHYR